MCYDIVSDDRRDDLSAVLSAHGARVQLSTFESALRTKRDVAALRAALRRIIDQDEARSASTIWTKPPWTPGSSWADDGSKNAPTSTSSDSGDDRRGVGAVTPTKGGNVARCAQRQTCCSGTRHATSGTPGDLAKDQLRAHARVDLQRRRSDGP
ncbi:CRISPR-associated endonuclease Cas2 [Amycolatopsis mediterranei]|uniref:CRISPR-associated endonuclease Cas2 n=1 Tax=Amycolatopsis mediterranei TaxID=33910 RepID=UPI003435826E